MQLGKPLELALRSRWKVLVAAVERFEHIDGTQWAAAFAHFAFFALFPLIVLFVTIASIFIERGEAGAAIIAYVELFVPIDGESRSFIFGTVAGVIAERGQASMVAFLMLAWAGMGVFSTLIRATNRAWGVDGHNWWRLPLRSLAFLLIMVALVLSSIATPLVAKAMQAWWSPTQEFRAWVYSGGNLLLPMFIVFLGLTLFYRIAPRRRTRISEVWIAALCATLLLQASDHLFVIYLKYFVSFNAVYGTFGGIIAMLLWIYLAGCIFVFGACLCAAQATAKANAEAIAATARNNIGSKT